MSVELEDGAPRDEIENYNYMRCIGSYEAAARMYQLSVTTKFPSVKELCVYLKEGQTVFFEEGNEEERLANSRSTELTASFKCSA